MKRLFFIITFFLVFLGGFGQTRPRAEVDLQYDRFTCWREYGINTSLTLTRSIYGKVRIITEGRPDLYVCFVGQDEGRNRSIRVVNHDPDRFKGEWQFVTREGEEDFTIRITDIFNADLSVCVVEGYDPLTKKYVKKKK